MNRRMWMLALLAWPALGAFKGARLKARRAAQMEKRGERQAVIPVIEFQVEADEPFPVRALDPVLHVGAYEVVSYRYLNMENTALLFTCTEPEHLKENAAIWLQYGNDTSTRTELGVYRSNSVA